jgi:hypothetical protein
MRRRLADTERAHPWDRHGGDCAGVQLPEQAPLLARREALPLLVNLINSDIYGFVQVSGTYRSEKKSCRKLAFCSVVGY